MEILFCIINMKDISKGNKVAYQVTISETGKQDNVSYGTTWNVAD